MNRIKSLIKIFSIKCRIFKYIRYFIGEIETFYISTENSNETDHKFVVKDCYFINE